MSRIGKKPIALPTGVTIKIEGNTVAVQGPKGKLDTTIPRGIKVEQAWFLRGDRQCGPAAASFRAEHAIFLLSR